MFEEVNIINRVAIGDIVRRAAARYPEKAAIIEGDMCITFSGLEKATNQFAHYLLSSGYKKGDSIATICLNSTAHAISLFGIQKAGLIWVPINPGISLDDKKFILEKTATKIIVTDYEIMAPQLSEFSEYPVIFTGEHEVPNGKTVANVIENQPTTELDVDIHDRDVAQIMFTSGTTGRPKGVMISHLSLYIASLSNIIETGIGTNDVGTIMMPMFHSAQHTFLNSFIHFGATSVVVRAFDPTAYLQLIEERKITFMFALPMMYRALIFHPRRDSFDLSSLDTCVYAMAPMDKRTLEKGIKELNVKFTLGTGQTEMYPGTMFFKPEEQLKRFGSYWGVSSILNDTAVMDDKGNFLPKGEVGEIVHRGPNVMKGYLDNEEDTIEVRKYGWHHTGDLGYWDMDGQLVFVDRKKDIIKTGGENVASVRVEGTLLNYEKIDNVAVVGLPHEKWSEAVTAFVTVKQNIQVTEEEIIEYAKQHLSQYEVPKKVAIMKALPMTTTGKIQKHVLREKYNTLYEQDADVKQV